MWKLARVLFWSALIAIGVWLAYEYFTFPDIGSLKNENPATTSLIERRNARERQNGRSVAPRMNWRPIEKISRHLQRAVLAGEDARFFRHNGFDWEEIQKVWDEAVREGEQQAKKEGDYDPEGWIPPLPSFKRGASTITQQLAKNLYLSEERSFLRKGREALITYFLERQLSKRRILELYLNVIEWGDNVYGAEAAARFYFGKSAVSLSRSEAAFLAAIVPGPRGAFDPKKNPKRVRRRQRILLRRMNQVRLRYE